MEKEIPPAVIDGMSGLPDTVYLYHETPYLKEFEAEVLKVLEYDDVSYIVLNRTCFYPEGGGQPGDVGSLIFPSGQVTVVDTQTIENVVAHIAGKGLRVKEGDTLTGRINWDIRYERMKQHTASHVLFASTRKALGLDSLMYMGVQIGEDSSRIDVNYGRPITHDDVREIERLSNQICLEDREVISRRTTRIEAEKKYGRRLGVTETTPSGDVLVVEVEDWDVGLCSGTHVKSTSEIGLIKIIDRFRLKKGVERIEFTAGRQGYHHYIEAMEKISDLAQMLKSSTAEVGSRVRGILKERDDLKKELRGLREQLVESQTHQLQYDAKSFGSFKLLKKKLSNWDAQSMKRTASKLTEKDPFLIVVLGSESGDNAFIVGAAGEEAVKEGVNMSEAIREASGVIKGGGGGHPKMAQAGGRSPGKLDEALSLYACKVLEGLSD